MRASRPRSTCFFADLKLLSVKSPAQDKWSAVYNVRTILLSIQSLLGGAPHCSSLVLSPPGRVTRFLMPPNKCWAAAHAGPTSRSDPNLESPLNGHAASIWHSSVEYKKALNKHTSNYAVERRAS